MRTVKIHCIVQRAMRTKRLDMISIYKSKAVFWGDDTALYHDEDHRLLNSLWDEDPLDLVEQKSSNCSTCRGL